jgi:hypothetical protein
MATSTRRSVISAVLSLYAFAMVGWAAVDAFGPLRGAGVAATVWLLVPYRCTRTRANHSEDGAS